MWNGWLERLGWADRGATLLASLLALSACGGPDTGGATVQDLMRYIKGPDFPTGALVYGRDGIRDAYEKGRGRVVMRARAEIENPEGGKPRIIVTEIPYMVNKARTIEQIAAKYCA